MHFLQPVVDAQFHQYFVVQSLAVDQHELAEVVGRPFQVVEHLDV